MGWCCLCEGIRRVFADRLDAARQLAASLAPYRGHRPLVLAVPRGGVPMGVELARRLEGELDLAMVRKLRAPAFSELAIGVVDESGWHWLSPDAVHFGATASYVEAEKRTQLAELRRRRALYTPSRAPIPVEDRIVIVVDDGLATGATMVGALHGVRQRGPRHVVCAVPVAAPDSLRMVAEHADEVVCLMAPPSFQAVGQFYRSFPQLDDEQVIRLLHEAVQERGSHAADR